MNTAHAPSAQKQTDQTLLSKKLDDEAGELEALHTGLRRHLTAWRDANESAIMRLGAVMARIDAILERAERTRA
jgi:hypothetical protein